VYSHEINKSTSNRLVQAIFSGESNAQLCVATAHLGKGEEVRLNQLRIVSRILDSYSPCFLLGGLNCSNFGDLLEDHGWNDAKLLKESEKEIKDKEVSVGDTIFYRTYDPQADQGKLLRTELGLHGDFTISPSKRQSVVSPAPPSKRQSLISPSPSSRQETCTLL